MISQLAPSSPLSQKTFKYKSVMLIDDDEIDNFLNQRILNTNGFAEKIHVNRNGPAALDALNLMCVNESFANQLLPDVIFVDVNMPMMNGFEFIAGLEENNFPTDKTKIVILTSSASEEDRLKADKLKNRVFFLSKPLSKTKLETIG
jgi:CheY-like chemotaxis protein